MALPKGPAPAPRVYHSTSVLKTSKTNYIILLFGGRGLDNKVFNDLWYLSRDSAKGFLWNKVKWESQQSNDKAGGVTSGSAEALPARHGAVQGSHDCAGRAQLPSRTPVRGHSEPEQFAVVQFAGHQPLSPHQLGEPGQGFYLRRLRVSRPRPPDRRAFRARGAGPARPTAAPEAPNRGAGHVGRPETGHFAAPKHAHQVRPQRKRDGGAHPGPEPSAPVPAELSAKRSRQNQAYADQKATACRRA